MKSQFLLDPEITFFNHGSFGACPKPILEDYQKWQLELEREPVLFIQKTGPLYLRAAKESMAAYINCDASDFFFTPNPTIAVNTIMRSLDLKPGDEILTTNHEYGAMDRTWNFYCRKSGARLVRANIELPVISHQSMVDTFFAARTENTKVIFVNHISSATALIFPVEEICRRAKDLGIMVIIDGAHVPGHIALDLKALDPDFYTGTLHKWMLAPKGTSFLYVKKSLQDMLDPLVVSWGYDSESPGESQFLDYHEYQGTRDISAFLTAPACISFLEENDWTQKSAECKRVILDNYERFCDLVGSKPICPLKEEFLGQMCSIPITTSNAGELKQLLFDKYRIEIPVMSLNGAYYLRISYQAYNTADDLENLYAALKEIIQMGLILR